MNRLRRLVMLLCYTVCARACWIWIQVPVSQLSAWSVARNRERKIFLFVEIQFHKFLFVIRKVSLGPFCHLL
jgi:hypothetical protein